VVLYHWLYFCPQLGVVVPIHALTLPEEPITGPGEYWCDVTVTQLISANNTVLWSFYTNGIESVVAELAIWTVFGLSGEWSGHGQGAHVRGAVCGAQPTDADEEATTKARTVRFRIVFSLLDAAWRIYIRNLYK